LLACQFALHFVNLPLEFGKALPLAFLYEAPDKEKQEENDESDYHVAHSFLSKERI
jgi:hypothetical protein